MAVLTGQSACDTMDTLHNSANINAYVEPKAEERELLCSNTVDVRSSALDVTTHSPTVAQEVTLNYLASVLVEAYFDHKEQQHARKQPKESGHILPRFD